VDTLESINPGLAAVPLGVLGCGFLFLAAFLATMGARMKMPFSHRSLCQS